MQLFLQASGIAFVAVVLSLVLKQGNQSIGALLSLMTCVMVIIFALRQLKPLVDFFGTLDRMVDLDAGLVKTLFKAVGISVIAEMAELICTDSGNSAMGKALQYLASVIILCLTIPIMTAFLELIEEILKGL